jgi:hypothetical protein
MVGRFEKFEGGGDEKKESRDDYLGKKFEERGGLDSIYKGNSFNRAVNAIMLLGYSEQESTDILQDETNPYAGKLLDILGGMPENGYRIDPEAVIRESGFRFGRGEKGALMYVLPEVRRGVSWKRKIYPALVQIVKDSGYEYEEKEAVIWRLVGAMKKEKIDVVGFDNIHFHDDPTQDYFHRKINGLISPIIESIEEEYYPSGMPNDLKLYAIDQLKDIIGNDTYHLERIAPFLSRAEEDELVEKLFQDSKFSLAYYILGIRGMKTHRRLHEKKRDHEDYRKSLENRVGKEKLMERHDDMMRKRKGGSYSYTKVSGNATQELFDRLIYTSYEGMITSRSDKLLISKFKRELLSGELGW